MVICFPPKKVVVTAGREFKGATRMADDFRCLSNNGLQRVAQGGARGGDQFAKFAWRRFCMWPRTEETYAVTEAQDGKWPSAGPRRNARMLRAEQPDLVLGYPDPTSVGTWSCLREALRMGMTIAVWVPWMNVEQVRSVLALSVRIYDDEPRFVVTLETSDGDHAEKVARLLRAA